jgi:SHS family sialic acid transporter-like MFS transporter
MLVGCSGIWGTILAENLPSEVRAAGVGFIYNLAQVGGGIAPYVVLSSLRRFEITMSTGIALFTIVPTILATALLRFTRETRDVRLF